MYGDLERVENLINEGTPDVNYCLTIDGVTKEGWIELKCIEHLPVQEGTIFVPKYSQLQRLWHKKRLRAKGRISVLLYITRNREYWLITGSVAITYLGLPITQRSLKTMPAFKFKAGIEPREIFKRL